MKLTATAFSAIGRRESNQDSLLLDGRAFSQCDKLFEQRTLSQTPAVIAIADGAGGERSGEFFSNAVLTGLTERLRAVPSENLDFKTISGFIDEIQEQLENTDIFGGTTLSMMILTENSFTALNIGDSPIFLLRNGELIRLSKEHTVAREKIDAGYPRNKIEEADYHCLTQCLGARGYESVYNVSGEVKPNDRLLIASDGLLLRFSEEKLRKIMCKKSPNSFINFTKCAKIDDNVSYILVDVGREE